jgi:hypothetical protein
VPGAWRGPGATAPAGEGLGGAVGCVWHGQAHGHRGGGRSPQGDFPGGPRGRRGERKKGECQPVGGGGVADLGVREGEGEPLERSIPAPNTGAHPLTFAINPNPNPRGLGCNRGACTLTLAGSVARDGVGQLAVGRTWTCSEVGAGVPEHGLRVQGRMPGGWWVSADSGAER